MPIEQIIVLALIQGITEFLPISSSGHLILVPALTGWRDQGVVTPRAHLAEHLGDPELNRGIGWCGRECSRQGRNTRSVKLQALNGAHATAVANRATSGSICGAFTM